MSIIFYALAVGTVLAAVFVLLWKPREQASPSAVIEELTDDEDRFAELLLDLERDAEN